MDKEFDASAVEDNQPLVVNFQAAAQTNGIYFGSIQILKDFVNQVNPNWTTQNLCDLFIKPLTANRKCSFLDIVTESGDVLSNELGTESSVFLQQFKEFTIQNHVHFYEKMLSPKKAKYFISHCWSYRFLDLVESIEEFLQIEREHLIQLRSIQKESINKQKNLESKSFLNSLYNENTLFSVNITAEAKLDDVPNEICNPNENMILKESSADEDDSDQVELCPVWVDLFVVNQWAGEAHPTKEFISDELRLAIHSIGHTCLILNKISEGAIDSVHANAVYVSNPFYSFTRTWCLWEVFCSRVFKGKVKFSVQMNGKDRGELIALLMSDSTMLMKELCALDIAQTETTLSRDKQLIMIAANSVLGGLDKVNNIVLAAFREWVRNMMLNYFDSTSPKHYDSIVAKKNPVELTATDGSPSQSLKLLRFESFSETFDSAMKLELKEQAETALYLHDQGNHDASELIYKKVIARREVVFGENHGDTLISLNNFAILLHHHGKFFEAEVIHRIVYQRREKKLGSDHPDTLLSLNNLAVLLHFMQKLDEAEEFYRKILSSLETSLGLDHIATINCMNNLAIVLKDKENWNEAESFFRTVLFKRRVLLGADHPDAMTSLTNLLILISIRGEKLNEAEELFIDLISRRHRLLGEEHRDTLTAQVGFAALLHKRKKYDEAEEIYRSVLTKRERVFGRNHRDSLHTMYLMGVLLKDSKKLEVAEGLLRHVYQKREKVLGYFHQETYAALYQLAETVFERKRFDEAGEFYLSAVMKRSNKLGPRHPDTLESIEKLNKFNEKLVHIKMEAAGSDSGNSKRSKESFQSNFSLRTVLNYCFSDEHYDDEL